MEAWIQKLLLWVFPVIISVTWHEVAHAYVAKLRGDKTATEGRLLRWNPFYHLDGIGTIIVPVVMILMNSGLVYGWGRPLPINPNVLKNPQIDRPLVAISGLLMCLVMAFLFSLLLYLGDYLASMRQNQLALIINETGNNGISINMTIFLVNLLPIPPMDMGRFVESFLSKRHRYFLNLFEPVGLIIAVIILFLSPTKAMIAPAQQSLCKWVISSSDSAVAATRKQANKLWQRSLKALPSPSEYMGPSSR